MAPSMSTFAGFETYQELMDAMAALWDAPTPNTILPLYPDSQTGQPRIVLLTYIAPPAPPATDGRRFYVTLVRDYVQGRPTFDKWTYGGAAVDESQHGVTMDLKCVDATNQTIDGHFRRFMPGQWQ